MPTLNEMRGWKYAYELGFEAGRILRNQKVAANRFDSGTRQHDEWMRGFTAACEKRGVKPLLGEQLAAQGRV